ncbi:MAG TPA: PLP-dependent aminotransferase family protein [Polyangiales bacterium]
MRKAQPGVWRPDIRRGAKPLYLAIVEAIEDDIREGRLNLTDRLPPQRELARVLDLNYATISRAYAEAQRRGLIYSRVGQGTFVCRPRKPAARAASGRVDMTMNLPPEPQEGGLEERMARGLRALEGELRPLLRYQEFGGSDEARAAAAHWLRRRGIAVAAERVLVCPGAQTALLALLGMLAKPGDAVLCESLTYPGLRAAAAQLSIRLIGIPCDDEGPDPDAFKRACQEQHPKALYANPTLLNPTTLTMSLARREVLVKLARQHGLPIVEDDAYGVLPESAPPPLFCLAPDLTYYLTGFAKFLGAGLRVSYLVAPDERRSARLSTSLRALSVMASPLTVALATRWVEDGTADAVLSAVRRESIARQNLARKYLRGFPHRTHPEAFHLWLTLPPPWTRATFASHLRAHDVHVAVSDAFAVGPGETPEAVRLCFGGAATREDTERALSLVVDALEHPASTTTAFF